MGSSGTTPRGTDGSVVGDEALTRVALTSLCESAARTTRAISAPGFSMLIRECAQSHRGIASLTPEFGKGDGLKNRYRLERKSWIRQVLISRTLSAYGEVAERLKPRFAKRQSAFRPSPFLLTNPGVSRTSRIERLGCCWLWRPGLGS